MTLTVSAGQRQLQLANLIGKKKAQIQRYATQESLNISFKYRYDNATKETAIDQNPAAGSMVKEGSTVVRTLSRGKKFSSLCIRTQS